MQQNSENSGCTLNYLESSDSLLEQVTPLARRINCLDVKQIANVCVENIPKLVGARLTSLYTIDETNTILCLQKANHPFPINKIVSINQNPPSPMVMAAKSKSHKISSKASLRPSSNNSMYSIALLFMVFSHFSETRN